MSAHTASIEIGANCARKTAFSAPESTKKPSLRAAINAMCKECLYDPIGGVGNWRQQVTNCTAPKCPLYPVRPRSSA